MPRMSGGVISCRVSYAPGYTERRFYCDECKCYFDDRDRPPCEDSKEERLEKVEKWRKR